MKKILLAFFVFGATDALASMTCPDLSGKFSGLCESTCGLSKPSVSYEIEQSACRSVKIGMIGSLGTFMQDYYDLKKPVRVATKSGSMTYAAAYSASLELVTTVIMENGATQNLIEFTHYSMSEENQTRYLDIAQDIFGFSSGKTCKMVCHIPAR